jgi:hypothetical protein
MALGVVLLLGVAGSAAAYCQAGSGQGNNNNSQSTVRPPFSGRQDPNANPPFDDYDVSMNDRRLRALNMERQKQMVADASKLLRLAKELNDEVASTTSETFTPDQLRKIAEIEKLARNVRERMASAVGTPQPMLQTGPGYVYPAH